LPPEDRQVTCGRKTSHLSGHQASIAASRLSPRRWPGRRGRETRMRSCRRLRARDRKRGKGIATPEQPREPKQSWRAQTRTPGCGRLQKRRSVCSTVDFEQARKTVHTHGGDPRLRWRRRLRPSVPRGERAVCRRRARRRSVVVHLSTDAEVAVGFRNPCASSARVDGTSDGQRLSCCHNTRFGACRRRSRFVTEQRARHRSPGASLLARSGSARRTAARPAFAVAQCTRVSGETKREPLRCPPPCS